MKAKIVIENSQASIELTPENLWEKDLIEDIYNERNLTLETSVNVDHDFGDYKNHKIAISIKQER